MPLATQLTIRLRNDVGVLARLCRDLSDAGVNLIGLSAHEWGQRGVVRLLVVNPQQAKEALRKAGYRCLVDQVVFTEIKNRPGALAKTVEKLARAHINIESAYATAHLRSQKRRRSSPSRRQTSTVRSSCLAKRSSRSATVDREGPALKQSVVEHQPELI